MVEVFKTDVTNPERARKVIGQIHASLNDHYATFDLQDCDHILRVTSMSATIHPHLVIELVAKAGHHAEVLADEYQNLEEAL